MQDYQQNLHTDEERERFAKVPLLLETFWAVAAEDTRLIQAGQKDEALAFLMDKTVPARTELLGALRNAVKLQEGELRDELSEVEAEAQRTLKVLVTLAVVSIAGLVLLSPAAAARSAARAVRAASASGSETRMTGRSAASRL